MQYVELPLFVRRVASVFVLRFAVKWLGFFLFFNIILLRKTVCLNRNLHLSVIFIAFTDILSDHLIIICRT